MCGGWLLVGADQPSAFEPRAGLLDRETKKIRDGGLFPCCRASPITEGRADPTEALLRARGAWSQVTPDCPFGVLHDLGSR